MEVLYSNRAIHVTSHLRSRFSWKFTFNSRSRSECRTSGNFQIMSINTDLAYQDLLYINGTIVAYIVSTIRFSQKKLALKTQPFVSDGVAARGGVWPRSTTPVASVLRFFRRETAICVAVGHSSESRIAAVIDVEGVSQHGPNKSGRAHGIASNYLVGKCCVNTAATLFPPRFSYSPLALPPFSLLPLLLLLLSCCFRLHLLVPFIRLPISFPSQTLHSVCACLCALCTPCGKLHEFQRPHSVYLVCLLHYDLPRYMTRGARGRSRGR